MQNEQIKDVNTLNGELAELEARYHEALDREYAYTDGRFSTAQCVAGGLALGGVYAVTVALGAVFNEPIWYGVGAGYLLAASVLAPRGIRALSDHLARINSEDAKDLRAKLYMKEDEIFYAKILANEPVMESQQER